MSKKEITLLDRRKQAIEKELKEISDFLNAEGMPGLQGDLVDREGFPLPGIDVYSIREARQRFHKLNKDHCSLMKTIETELHNYFFKTKSRESRSGQASGVPVSVETSLSARIPPFAEITEVSDASPASQGGLKPSDKILRFGRVDYTNQENLQGLALYVRTNQGRDIKVHVLRKNSLNQYTEMTLTVRPDTWNGDGLLGCRFKPI
mmetsp:Transcript_3750/g.5737  ORF Transcript_3750/g.5737 Transcript_3750/m.5737 type:complete len:206 (-) Transcript_3750:518-1135(-)